MCTAYSKGVTMVTFEVQYGHTSQVLSTPRAVNADILGGVLFSVTSVPTIFT